MPASRINRSARQQGFSMVEFLVAAFIMAIGLLGLTMLMTINLRKSGQSRERATATYVAESLLQRAQAEGQVTYFAKINSITTLPTNFSALFTTNAGSGVTETTFGGFNVDGVQVTKADTKTLVDSISTLVPDQTKRSNVFIVSWVRRAYNSDPGFAAGAPQAQEFLVNVAWNEEGQTKYLTLSRIIRY